MNKLLLPMSRSRWRPWLVRASGHQPLMFTLWWIELSKSCHIIFFTKQKRRLSRQPGLSEVMLCKLPLRGRSTKLTFAMTPSPRQQNPSPSKRKEACLTCPLTYRLRPIKPSAVGLLRLVSRAHAWHNPVACLSLDCIPFRSTRNDGTYL